MKYPPCRLQHPQGLTLIEVLISVAILATTIMSVFTIYSQCFVEIRRAKNRTLATNLTQMMMEMIIASPYAPSVYHGLSTNEEPSPDNPVKNNLDAWKASLQTFPTSAIGVIDVTTETYTYLVVVHIDYQDYGRISTNTLSLHLAKHF
ncbi:Tfp pilus assembly protein PilV [Candidatus Vecturithrix granuli]|uniref:Tfp pilus assembly protein PilV n=1 Tax=Vecturithrix granuli TaxID=1499967 RepID=A0A081C850_VECG1|nr:Tfp pilus assembly protein PilV [Candidatus Vecturithrix granuli]